MKKFSLKIFMILSTIATLFSGVPLVYATGSATLGLSGASSVAKDSNITLTVNVSSISGVVDGLGGVNGVLNYDTNYLEYVSSAPNGSIPLSCAFKSSSKKVICSVGGTGETITSSSANLINITFKAIKEGSTTISFTSVKGGDALGDLVNITPTSKSINIGQATSSSTKSTSTSTSKSSSTLSNSSSTTKQAPTNKSSDANLTSLSASGYILSPEFNKDTLEYTVDVPKGTPSVIINYAKSNSSATVSGAGSQNLNGDGTDTIKTIKVTAEDGTVKEYKITFVQKDMESDKKNNDASLKSLSITGYTLNPTFKPSVTNYSISVGNNVTSLNVSGVANNEKATVTIKGGSNLKVGINTVSAIVTAEDGTQKTYVINVTRQAKGGDSTTQATKSSDNRLTNLVINSAHTITPNFSQNVDAYEVVVPYEVEKLELSPVLSDSKASYKIIGNSNLLIGQVTPVRIEVTAEDDSVRVITLNVTRTNMKSETDLKDIIIDGYDLDPKFNPDVLEYEIDVPNKVDKLDITAKAAAEGSKVEIIGNKNLKEGENTIFIKVTDKNGYSKYYQIKVNKQAKKILGLTPTQFAAVSGVVGASSLCSLFLLLGRKKKDKEEKKEVPVQPLPQQPIIDFKPEFNFSSHNGTDDDIVYPGGTLNQSSNNTTEKLKSGEEKKQITEVLPLSEDAGELPYVEKNSEEDIPYDPYDDIVTKDELIDAIQEGLETKNPAKLRMLLDQEALNRRKEELRKMEEEENNKE